MVFTLAKCHLTRGGIAAGTKATRDLGANGDNHICPTGVQRLPVGVDGHKLHTAQPGLHHAVDGVATGSAHTHHTHDSMAFGALRRRGKQARWCLRLHPLRGIAAGAAEEIGEGPLAH